MSLPPLYALRAFESAARMGSFSKTAILLNVTPGAISRHIRTLEQWFDCELFVRMGPKVEITQAGRRLAAQLEEGFSQLEQACDAFRSHQREIRLKAPSTLTLSWLLNVLRSFRESDSTQKVRVTSVWMDTDKVDFAKEPYDCAILLGSGQFGDGTESHHLFDEWLIPVCSPGMVKQAQRDLSACELIHPSPDGRDWRRWLKESGRFPGLDITRGILFDTLEQGNLAAISGYGVSVGDLLLSLNAIHSGMLALPFPEAIATGESYYFVCQKGTFTHKNSQLLYHHLKACAPDDYPANLQLLPKTCPVLSKKI
ncbi:LysR substrate-binding domain-containing protein [Klebsiella sp. BIGb0407]|uniref:LysR substrate-binding domain-containing protein n=1 Tax=Klebsiella sp. BIGb0407 TaxID=2940603 RepID=UPI0021681874|nr:LysR substrate-binding domain-containing protein [Klebsiella sp. BIGb0407]MCS3429957.1 DNA-binding transcriptional LysR family regulator [Klebsiella sp. BIGb0407]